MQVCGDKIMGSTRYTLSPKQIEMKIFSNYFANIESILQIPCAQMCQQDLRALKRDIMLLGIALSYTSIIAILGNVLNNILQISIA